MDATSFEPEASTLRSNATEDRHGGVLATRHWSMVLAAGHSKTPQFRWFLLSALKRFWANEHEGAMAMFADCGERIRCASA